MVSPTWDAIFIYMTTQRAGEMEDLLRFPGLSSLRDACRDISFSADEGALLIVSRDCEAVLGGAILTSALYRSNKMVQVTFVEPVVTADALQKIIERRHFKDVLVVGLDVTGTLESKDGHTCIGVGTSAEELDVALGDTSTVIPASTVFSIEKLGADRYEGRIAAMSAAAVAMIRSPDDVLREIMDGAISEGILNESRAFRLYGTNFMPPRECLQYSVWPYLRGITGNREECERILEEADVPLAQRGSPLEKLSKEVKQRIVSTLVPRVNVDLLPLVVGPNFEVTGERPTSPLRWASNIAVLMRTVWMERREGLGLAVWIGDRARSLRMLMDLQAEHSASVVDAIAQIEQTVNEGEVAVEGRVAVVRSHEVSPAVLSECAVILARDTMSEYDYTILTSDQAIAVAWRPGAVALIDLVKRMQSAGLDPITTAESAVVLMGAADRSLLLEMLKSE